MTTLAEVTETGAIVPIVFGLLVAVVVLVNMVMFARRFIRCPAGKALVVTGKTPTGKPQIVTSGAVFVWPLLQEYAFLDLHPFTAEVDAGQPPCKATVTVAVGTSVQYLENAAQRLIGMSSSQIEDQVRGIVRGCMLQALTGEGAKSGLDLVASKARDAAAPALMCFGLEIVSLSVHASFARGRN